MYDYPHSITYKNIGKFIFHDTQFDLEIPDLKNIYFLYNINIYIFEGVDTWLARC